MRPPTSGQGSLHSWCRAPLHGSVPPWGDVSADESQALRKVSVVLEGTLEGKREVPLLPIHSPPRSLCFLPRSLTRLLLSVSFFILARIAWKYTRLLLI